MDPMSRKIKNNLQKSADSLNQTMPIITVPTAPIPVQTPYAVPMGIDCIALLSRAKLSEMHIKNPMLHFTFEKFSESFRQVVNPTSNNPARTKINQAIFLF